VSRLIAILALTFLLSGCGSVIRLGWSPPLNFYLELQTQPPATQPYTQPTLKVNQTTIAPATRPI
jgi:hypothetical protein